MEHFHSERTKRVVASVNSLRTVKSLLGAFLYVAAVHEVERQIGT